jgi:hypothetical protein
MRLRQVNDDIDIVVVRVTPYSVAAGAPMIIYGASMASRVCKMSKNRLKSGLALLDTLHVL